MTWSLFAGRTKVLVSSAALVLLATPSPSIAQTQVIGDTPTCPSCRIGVSRVTMLGSTGEYVLDPTSLSLARTADGRYLVTGFGDRNALNVFGGTGEHLGNLGRSGEGPGEYASPNDVVVGVGDTIWVLDRALRRLSMLDPSGRYRESWLISDISPFWFRLVNGSPLLSGFSTTADLAGIPLHQLRRGSGSMVPFGPPDQIMRIDRTGSLPRVLAAAPNGSGVWVGSVNKYELQLLGPDGALRRSVSRKASWFQEYDNNAPPVYEPSKPTVQGIQIDSRGRIWVFISVTRKEFRPRPRPRAGAREGPPLDMMEVLRNLQTIVEVIDPERGILVARYQVEGFLFPTAKHPTVVNIAAIGGGELSVEVATVQLIQP